MFISTFNINFNLIHFPSLSFYCQIHADMWGRGKGQSDVQNMHIRDLLCKMQHLPTACHILPAYGGLVKTKLQTVIKITMKKLKQ